MEAGNSAPPCSAETRPGTRRGIAEEIAQHLEDRYYELLVTGQSEDAAIRLAIDELKGEDLLARKPFNEPKNEPAPEPEKLVVN